MTLHTAYLGLGSNLGDRAANLRAALDLMPPDLQPSSASRIYETDPWGFADQPAFLNQVLQAQTSLSPRALLDFIKDIEVQVGRKPSFRYGPRIIDIDILLYDDIVIYEPGLTIPHPRLEQRAFALIPLAEIAPDLIHPLSNLPISELAARVDSSTIHPATGTPADAPS